MKPSELTSSMVRGELERLINEYPERKGSLLTDSSVDETNCVYYADQEGEPVSFPSYIEDNITAIMGSVALKTPVCIVGQWVDSFHPEFKEDEVIREVLYRNSTMRYAEIPFDPSVKLLLIRAQDQQDAGKPWGEIDLNMADSTFE